nr:hypothetical protein [Xenococcaceae cyanobacterium MO_207.B15]
FIFFSQGDPHVPIWGGIESQGLQKSAGFLVGNLALKPPISRVMFASSKLTVGTIQAALP